MRTNISPASLRLMLAQYCGTPFFILVIFSHAELPATLYYCDNNEDVVSNGITYKATSLNVSLPPEDLNAKSSGSIVIDNTTLDMSTMVNQCNDGPIICTIAVISADEPDSYIVEPTDTEIIEPEIDAEGNVMTAALTDEEVGDEQIPGDMMTPSTAPGMFASQWFGSM